VILSRVAQLEGQRAAQIAEARTAYREAREAANGAQIAAQLEVGEANDEARAEVANQVRKYGGGLAYFTVLCLTVFVLSVSLKEIHQAGAGMVEQIEPDAYTFEAGPLAALSAAVTGRINRRVYGIVHAIEKTTREAPEPVAPPTVWSRDRQGIPHRTTGEGVPRRAADHRRKWIPFSVNRAKVATSPAAPTGTPTPSTGTPADAAALEDEILTYVGAMINLESENFHAPANQMRLKGRDVIAAYLGPKATGDAVNELELAVVDFLNNAGPNPFAQHHERRAIGFNSAGKTCAIDEKRKAKTAINTPKSSAGKIAVTNGVVSAPKSDAGNMAARPCDYCGKTYTPKTWNQRFCSSKGDGNCKTEYHAAQHGGKRFNPGKYHGKNGK